MDAHPESSGSGRSKRERGPKGRPLDDTAVDEVRALLGDRPRQRDLLIEFLHLIQDRWGFLSAARLRALAEEMRLSQAEVYEVASFYDHFDVVKEGETPPPALTIRVCGSISCVLAGAEALIHSLRGQSTPRPSASCTHRASADARVHRPRALEIVRSMRPRARDCSAWRAQARRRSACLPT